jgi:hypothetical protein
MDSGNSALTVEPPLELTAGHLLVGLGTKRLPVILFSLVGLTDAVEYSAKVYEVVDSVIDQVAEAQLLDAGFRPVFVLDAPAFSRARSYGYLVELVEPRSAWEGTPTDWSEYIAARVASMMTIYRASAILTVGPDGLDDVARGVLRSLGLTRQPASKGRLPGIALN